MTDDDATRLDGASASTGGMRVVMLNARTAVLVPADAPDPAAPPADPSWPEAGPPWDAAADAVTHRDAADPAEGDPAGEAHAAGDADAWPDITEEHDTAADVRDTAAGMPPEAGPPDHDAAMVETGGDALRDSAEARADIAEGDARADVAEGDAGDDAAHGTRGAPGSDAPWRAELLARLDDLGRLLAHAPAPAPDDAVARLTAALDRLEQRTEAAHADIAARLDMLERAAADAGRTQSTSSDMAEAMSDIRMQLRMVEVQVGTLGKLLVAGEPDQGTGPDGLRTRLAELMAREQRLATGA